MNRDEIIHTLERGIKTVEAHLDIDVPPNLSLLDDFYTVLKAIKLHDVEEYATPVSYSTKVSLYGN